jgi:hypothetical protein
VSTLDLDFAGTGQNLCANPKCRAPISDRARTCSNRCRVAVRRHPEPTIAEFVAQPLHVFAGYAAWTDAEGNVSVEFRHESGCRFRVEVKAEDVRK